MKFTDKKISYITESVDFLVDLDTMIFLQWTMTTIKENLLCPDKRRLTVDHMLQ